MAAVRRRLRRVAPAAGDAAARACCRIRVLDREHRHRAPRRRRRDIKLLCRLGDGQTIETVAMETPARADSRRRSTVCVSSQVGCAVGCPFCATGHMGCGATAPRRRSSTRYAPPVGPCTVGEWGRRRTSSTWEWGSRSPTFPPRSSRFARSPRTQASARGESPSPRAGRPGIEQLAASGMPVTLAVSLHAATDELRNRLVPSTERIRSEGARHRVPLRRAEWAPDQLRVVLIGGVNDSIEQAEGLRDLARRAQAHINVIPMNRIDGSPWGPPSPRSPAAFSAPFAAPG